MKKAIISIKDKQYLVAKGDCISVDLLDVKTKTISWQPLLLIEDDKTSVGQPSLEDIDVKAKILDTDVKQPKVTAIRFKAKKRVHKVRGHRQRQTLIEITDIVKRK